MRLEIKNLNKTFPTGAGLLFGQQTVVHALTNASLILEEGDSLGIVGESGSGKTTLAKILSGFTIADSGEATLGSHNLLKISRQKRAELVQMVFQDPFASLNPKLLLGSQLMEAIPHAKGVSKTKEAERLLTQVGLFPQHLNSYPHQLSGGQRQRFAIARALASNPKLLLADEPVSSLDVSVQAQIINLLNNLRQQLRFSLMLISHDLSVVANTCDNVIVMKDGAIIEAGKTELVLEHPETLYTQRLLAAVSAA